MNKTRFSVFYYTLYVIPEFHKQTLLIQADIPSHCGHIFRLDEVSEATKNLYKNNQMPASQNQPIVYFFDTVLRDNCDYIYECQFDVIDRPWDIRDRFGEMFEADCSPPIKPLKK